jgi:hypothetical protein
MRIGKCQELQPNICWLTMLHAGCLLIAIASHAGEPMYVREVAKWQEVAVPPATNRGEHVVWSYAASYSKHEWRVFTDGKQTCAQLRSTKDSESKERPVFTPKAGRFRGASTFIAVDDGWLVGFNEGEFGAALYWFSDDGKRSFKISDHQIVAFFSLSDGIHAIEGLAHLSVSEGSVIRIARSTKNERWQANPVVKLPFAPYVISVCRDGTMLITLSDSLVSVGKDHKIDTLLADAPWSSLYPNSSILSRDEQKLYIGMCQFVGEFDLSTKKFRFLIPSRQFLNKLPKDDEQRMRKQYGN